MKGLIPCLVTVACTAAKTSMRYDGNEGREQHGFPPRGQLG
jgi:hypothetical protein